MARETGADKTLTLATVAIPGMSGYDLTIDEKIEEVKDIDAGGTTRVIVRKSWKIKADFEMTDLTRGLTGSISAGGWDGAYASEWDFSYEMPVDECSGTADVWAVFAARTPADWAFNATKWQCSDSLDVFLVALAAQAAEATFACPFGTGDGVLESASTEWTEEVSTEKLSVKQSDGVALTPGAESAVLIGHINTAVAAVLADGSAAGLAVACSDGTGTAFVTKFEVKCPDGHVTGSIELQGTGEFTGA